MGKLAVHDPHDRENAELTDFSPSRLATASKCGLAFDYQYIKKIPAPYETGAQLFGNAVHDGTQAWYELPNDGFKTTDLAPIIGAQWEQLLPPVIWTHVKELIDLDEECAATAAAIQFKRPTLKSPATTKEYLESEAHKLFMEKKVAMIDLCDALEEVKWPKDEDPYKAYQKTTDIGAMLQRRWQKLPRPLVERPFRVEFEGFMLRGRIDQLRTDPDANGVLLPPRLLDIKTGRNLMTQMEAFIQAFIYWWACKQDPETPEVNLVDFLMVRHNKTQQVTIDMRRHVRLASRILNGRARQIAMGQFEPSYGFWCKRCDFHDLCEKEISIWQGDGVIEVALPEAA